MQTLTHAPRPPLPPPPPPSSPPPPPLQASFCHVPVGQVLSLHDVTNIWHVPLMMQQQGVHTTVCAALGLPNAHKIDMSRWKQRLADKWDTLTEVRRRRQLLRRGVALGVFVFFGGGGGGVGSGWGELLCLRFTSSPPLLHIPLSTRSLAG